MPLEKWSDDVVVVHLADDPQLTEDLEAVESSTSQGVVNAVLDFGTVRFVNSSNIARLLKLRQKMISSGGRLVICNLGTQVWGAFLLTGLEKIFDFSDNVTTALATLQLSGDKKAS